jgi:uncharacterized damage-inducible protein DinB
MTAHEDSIANFIGVRKRTMKYVNVLPEAMMDWRPAPNKFSIGDIIRHLGSAERMFLHAIQNNEWRYPGHQVEKGRTLEEATNYLNFCHLTTIEGLRQLTVEQLSRKVKNALGYEVSAWRYITAMAEHEIHHRGQLSAYMQMNGIDPPQIFGLKVEQIEAE